MEAFRGYRLSELEINFNLEEALSSLVKAKSVWLDTETMGFTGLCFLIQFATELDPKKVHLIKVLDEKPGDVIRLLEELVKKELVIHNAQFDVFHLAKLYTISSHCEDYSFSSIWKAEAILRRDESVYENRLASTYCFYPKRVIDTMLIAQHTFPLGDEFLKGNGYAAYRTPYPLVDKIRDTFTSETMWRKMLLHQVGDEEAVDYLCSLNKIKVSTKGTNTKKIQSELRRNPNKYTVTAKVSYRARGVFSLKNLARYYRYVESDKVAGFDFLDSFTPMKKIKKLVRAYKTPTIENSALYQVLYDHCHKQYKNKKFINYSIRDIALLQVVHLNQPPKREYTQALITDMALVVYFANFQVYGVKVNRAVAESGLHKVNRKISETMANLSLLPTPLDKPTSSKVVKTWLREVVASHAQRPVDAQELDKLVPDTKKETVTDLVKKFPEIEEINLLSEFKSLKNLSHHIPKKRDTIFPSPHIYATVTNRMAFKAPNAQGIPPSARPCFTAPDGYKLCVGDFSQLELRLVAYLSNVKNLVKAFRENKDPHIETISAMSDGDLDSFARKKGVHIEDVRQIGKRLGFSVLYGTSSTSLAKELDCTIRQAEIYIEDYFRVNPEIKEAIEASNKKVTRIVTSKRYGKYRPYFCFDFDKTPIPTTKSIFGARRNFTMSRCVARVLFYMANDKSYMRRNLSHLPKKTKDRFLRSLRSAYWSIQGRIKREAFNFVIQSTGSYLTKKLQRDICSHFIPTGRIYPPNELDLIPSLNVHDELHFYVKDTKMKEALDQVKDETLGKLSKVVGGPLALSFDVVESWAEKK